MSGTTSALAKSVELRVGDIIKFEAILDESILNRTSP